MKLLEILLSNNLAPDEQVARSLIMRGDVLVDDRPETSPHAVVKPGMSVRVRADLGDSVSRGAAKLRPAIERTGFDCGGMIAMDLGVSTGGFTQVLLDRGAARVYAVDVAYGTVDTSIRNDPRVVLLERTNARRLTSAQVAERVARVVGDLSFISWRAVLPAVAGLVTANAELLLLVKPQFEIAASGKSSALEKGIATDRSLVWDCLVGLYNVWQENGMKIETIFPAALKGAKGNQEYFAHLIYGQPALSYPEYESLIESALNEVIE